MRIPYSVWLETFLSFSDMCAVIGVPDDKWCERVHAIVVFKDSQRVAEAEIIAFCKERTANYKSPRSVEIRQEPLPISGAGKILKSALRAPYWEGRA